MRLNRREYSFIMAKSINDHVLGMISYENIWKGETSITFFGKAVRIDLYINGDEDVDISPVQRDAFIAFKTAESRIISETESAIYDYYLDIYSDYRAMQLSEEQADKNVPSISSKEGLEPLIQAISLLIDYDFQDGMRRIGLLFECTWEPEHGVGVSIINEKISKVGFQDIML